MRASCRQLVSSRSTLTRHAALFLLCLVASAEAAAQASGTPKMAQPRQHHVPPVNDGVRLLDPRPLANDIIANARRRARQMDARGDHAVTPAMTPPAQPPPSNPPSSAARRDGPKQTMQPGVMAPRTTQEQASQPAQDAQQAALFDPRRLSASVVFDVRPNARNVTGTFGLTYVATDNYQVGLLLPVTYQGAPGNRLMANNVTLRNTFLRTFNDNGSFIGVTADTTFGDNVAFRRPKTFLTISPFLGLRLPDRYDLFVSASWGASIAATGRLTRALTDEWNVGLEYQRVVGVAGQLLPLRNQPQTILGIAELNRNGRQISFGLGANFANGTTGLAARLGLTQTFQ
jgi:hypothetical protein